MFFYHINFYIDDVRKFYAILKCLYVTKKTKYLILASFVLMLKKPHLLSTSTE